MYATGFDALTGSIERLNVRGPGRRARSRTRGRDGPRTYLGLMVPGFPNLFTITGPGSPGVVTNVPVAIEQHVEWIAGLLALRAGARPRDDRGGAGAADEWTAHVQDVASATLLPDGRQSWYMGANIPGKPRVFLPYIGGLDVYRRRCDEIAAAGYPGFAMARLPGRWARRPRQEAGHGAG